MHRIENAPAEMTAIRSQMAGRVELHGYNGGAIPDAVAAGRAGASL